MSEALGTIGYLSYYSGDKRACNACKAACATYHDHAVIMWKLIRVFQAFPSEETVVYLNEVMLTSPCPQHRWEAARSLGQIGTPDAEEALQLVPPDQHPLVFEMVGRSLLHIRTNLTIKGIH